MWSGLFGGEEGISVPSGLTHSTLIQYLLVGGAAVGGLSLATVLRATVFGRQLRAAGGDTRVGMASGVPVPWVRIAGAVLSAALASLGGSLLVMQNHLANHELAGDALSGLIFLLAVVGGTGTLVGPWLAAIMYICVLRQSLIWLGRAEPAVVFGLLMVAIWGMPEGIGNAIGRQRRARDLRRREAAAHLDEALKSLPVKDYDAVALRYLAGMSEAQTAEALGCPRSTATNRVLRGLEKIRKFIGRRGYVLGPAAVVPLLEQTQAAMPAGLAAQVVAGCTGKAVVSSAILSAVTTVESVLFWAKVKVAAWIAATAVLVAGLAGLAAHQATAGRAEGRRSATPSPAMGTTADLPRARLAQGVDFDATYIIKLERPFEKETPTWLPLRITVGFKDGKGVGGGAFSTQFNNCWHAVDAGKLRLADGRLSGEMAVTFRHDAVERHKAADDRLPPATRKKIHAYHHSGRPETVVQTIALDVPLGHEPAAGAAPGTARWEKDLTREPRWQGRPSAAPARAWAAPRAETTRPMYVELQLESWSIDPKRSNVDTIDGDSVILLRGRMEKGRLSEVTALGTMTRGSPNFDRLWTVAASDLRFDGASLRGQVTLNGMKDPVLKKEFDLPWSMPHRQGDDPLALTIAADLVGDRWFGSARCAYGSVAHEAAVHGGWRTYPYAVFADRSPRTVAHDMKPDPELVEQARQEALVPIRPGEPGKREFWTEYARLGGCSFREPRDGVRMVQWANELIALGEFRRRINRGNEITQPYQAALGRDQQPSWLWSFIAPPNFDLPPVPQAASYRFSVNDFYKKALAKPLEFVPEKPWAPLTPIWKDLPPGQWILTVTALDKEGKEIGEPQLVALPKREPFNGPYWSRTQPVRETALKLARWKRDHPRNAFARGLNVDVVGASDGVDTQLWNITATAVYGGLVTHALSDDAAERNDALETAVTAADLWLKNFPMSFLPDTYKGWTFDQWVYGTCWLDLYHATGDPRYADAASLLAKRLGQCQLPSGAWTDTTPDNFENFRKQNHDPATGLYFPRPAAYYGGWPQEYDPSGLLYFLGRVRKELKTDEFRPIEDRAWGFLLRNSIARFDWRKQGPGESRRNQHPWPTVPDAALHCFEYLALDLPGRPVDRELMTDLLRWCEDRAVEWGRDLSREKKTIWLAGNCLTPVVSGENTPTPRMALAYARLAALTGSRLHRAKAEALLGTVQAAQNPVSGYIAPSYDLDPSGQSAIGIECQYDALALWRLAQLWEGVNTPGAAKKE